jgi:hypothetical protein
MTSARETGSGRDLLEERVSSGSRSDGAADSTDTQHSRVGMADIARLIIYDIAPFTI